MKRVWTFGDFEKAKVGECGFETFDYGYQIGLWIKISPTEAKWCRMTTEAASVLGCALASTDETRTDMVARSLDQIKKTADELWVSLNKSGGDTQ